MFESFSSKSTSAFFSCAYSTYTFIDIYTNNKGFTINLIKTKRNLTILGKPASTVALVTQLCLLLRNLKLTTRTLGTRNSRTSVIWIRLIIRDSSRVRISLGPIGFFPIRILLRVLCLLFSLTFFFRVLILLHKCKMSFVFAVNYFAWNLLMW